MGEKIIPRNWVGTKYGIESAMPHKMLIFKAGIDFSFPADGCHIVCLLEMCWPIGVSRSTYDDDNSEILNFSHGIEIDVFKKQFHNGINFSQGIDPVESMPGVLNSLKIRAQISWACVLNAEFYVIMYIYCRVANISHKFSLAKVFNRPGKECTVIGRKCLLWRGNTKRHLVWKNRRKAAN